jgi:fucose 4-O-acetylase-like acetyltransferase
MSRPATVIPRSVWLDAAKGIGILLVVLGHCLAGLHDAGLVPANSALWLLFYGIYVFHMPLFFFLSASLIYQRVVARPARVLSSSVKKIAWPYFLWATVQVCVLQAASGMVNHPTTHGLAASLIRLLWAPAAQFWFLYALFFLHMTVLVSVRFGGKPLFCTVIASAYVACMLSSDVSSFVTSYISLTCILF